MILIELKFAGMSTQVFNRLATQHKSTQVEGKSSLYAWNLRLFVTCVDLRAEYVGQPSQVRKPVLSLQNLRRLVSICESVAIQFDESIRTKQHPQTPQQTCKDPFKPHLFLCLLFFRNLLQFVFDFLELIILAFQFFFQIVDRRHSCLIFLFTTFA